MADAGSYRAQGSAAVESETERLRRQAAAVWTRERAALLAAGLAPGQRLLDLGCGPGGLLERLRPELGSVVGPVAVGVDVNHDLLRHVHSAPVARADGAWLPFQDAVFDFVLVRLVLRHAPARERIIGEAARVLRTGGILCAVDVDEAATAFDPEPASWPALRAALAESAVRRGGIPSSAGGCAGSSQRPVSPTSPRSHCRSAPTTCRRPPSSRRCWRRRRGPSIPTFSTARR